MKKVLCTGSGGFVFSNFIRKALYNSSGEYSFASIDVCKSPNVLNNIYANKGHKLYIGDVSDKHFVDVIFELERPDIVLHGAAERAVNDSIELIRSNIVGTQVIIDACRKWKSERLIYVSSGEVYGPGSESWSETNQINPKHLFAASKASAELLVKVSGVNYNISRCCDNYGPRQSVKNIIPQMIGGILSEQRIEISEQAMMSKEWLHVEDHCSALMAILDKGQENETYNISANHEFTNIEVFHEISNILGKGSDLLKFVENKSAAESRYSLDATKIKNLGWRPTWKFKHGLTHACAWFEKNNWFWKNQIGTYDCKN